MPMSLYHAKSVKLRWLVANVIKTGRKLKIQISALNVTPKTSLNQSIDLQSKWWTLLKYIAKMNLVPKDKYLCCMRIIWNIFQIAIWNTILNAILSAVCNFKTCKKSKFILYNAQIIKSSVKYVNHLNY